MRGALILILAVTLLCPLTLAHATRDENAFSVRRFMLAAGTNDGGTSRVRLRYAGSDAEAIAKVFRDLGGVDPSDCIVLLNPDRQAFRETPAMDPRDSLLANVFVARSIRFCRSAASRDTNSYPLRRSISMIFVK